jgi:hypothetical protein
MPDGYGARKGGVIVAAIPLKVLSEEQEFDVHYCMEVGDDFIFRCLADDRTHALGKFMEEEPEATVIGVWLTEE